MFSIIGIILIVLLMVYFQLMVFFTYDDSNGFHEVVLVSSLLIYSVLFLFALVVGIFANSPIILFMIPSGFMLFLNIQCGRLEEGIFADYLPEKLEKFFFID